MRDWGEDDLNEANDKRYLFEEDSVWHALAVMALPACSLALPVHARIRKQEGWPQGI